MKRRYLVVITSLLIALPIVWLMANGNQSAMSSEMAVIGGEEFRLHAPKTAADHEAGLSIFDSLEANEGMIFRGLPPSQLSIWMKDMSFAIDVIWLNDRDQITHIEQSIEPESYPRAYQNPDSAPSTYLIELPANTVKRLGIKPGDKVSFN